MVYLVKIGRIPVGRTLSLDPIDPFKGDFWYYYWDGSTHHFGKCVDGRCSDIWTCYDEFLEGDAGGLRLVYKAKDVRHTVWTGGTTCPHLAGFIVDLLPDGTYRRYDDTYTEVGNPNNDNNFDHCVVAQHSETGEKRVICGTKCSGRYIKVMDYNDPTKLIARKKLLPSINVPYSYVAHVVASDKKIVIVGGLDKDNPGGYTPNENNPLVVAMVDVDDIIENITRVSYISDLGSYTEIIRDPTVPIATCCSLQAVAKEKIFHTQACARYNTIIDLAKKVATVEDNASVMYEQMSIARVATLTYDTPRRVTVYDREMNKLDEFTIYAVDCGKLLAVDEDNNLYAVSPIDGVVPHIEFDYERNVVRVVDLLTGKPVPRIKLAVYKGYTVSSVFGDPFREPEIVETNDYGEVYIYPDKPFVAVGVLIP